MTRWLVVGLLVLLSLLGVPALITRCGMVEGRPLSVEFVGALYREDALLRVAHAYEQATDWHKKKPPVKPA